MFKSVKSTKILLVLILGLLGLYSKFYTGIGHEFTGNYFGGIVYVLVFIIAGSIVFPNANPIIISLIVLSFTCIVEFTQLIQSTYMNSLRSHFLIRSLIGSVFNVIDFVFYFVGALMGYGVLIIIKKEH